MTTSKLQVPYCLDEASHKNCCGLACNQSTSSSVGCAFTGSRLQGSRESRTFSIPEIPGMKLTQFLGTCSKQTACYSGWTTVIWHSSRERDGRAWVHESSLAPTGSTVKPTLNDAAPMNGMGAGLPLGRQAAAADWAELQVCSVPVTALFI